MVFKKAEKKNLKLRMALDGVSGSGKTYTALKIATALANGGGIALIDTERRSASKYAAEFNFDVLELGSNGEAKPFHPDKYIEGIAAAQAEGYNVLIIDSLSHAWSGKGGLLELVDEIARRKFNGNTYSAWSEATPIQNRLIDAITSSTMHVICTMRAKQDYVLEVNDKGKTAPKKVGLAAVQRDGTEYEFDVWMRMDADNTGVVQKTRCSALNEYVKHKPGDDLAKTLAAWLNSGAPAEQRPADAPKPPAPDKPKETEQKTGDQAQKPDLTVKALNERTSKIYNNKEDFKLVAVYSLDLPQDCRTWRRDHLQTWHNWLVLVEHGNLDPQEVLMEAISEQSRRVAKEATA